MAMQNIGAANKDDAFYRYKMPRMITKIEGRGNGIKTNIVNMVDIAKALGRPGSYITKYFGCQLGAQSKFDDKTGTSHVNGSHQTAKLAGLLENFIKKYVQCYGCGNPETEIIISKSQMITLNCAACGFLSDVDMEDKLKRLIVKNPPEQKKGKDKKAMRRAELERVKEGEAADEELKKIKKDAANKKGSSTVSKDASSKKSANKKANVSDEDLSPPSSHGDENEAVTSLVDTEDDDDNDNDDDDDDVEWQTDTSAEAARLRIQEQLSAVTAGMVMLSTIEEKPISGKNSPKREKKPSDPYRKLVEEIKAHLKRASSVSEVKSYLDSVSCTQQETMNAVFEALFDGARKGFSKEVAKKTSYIAAVTEEEGSQLLLLHAIEAFCAKGSPEAVKEVALVLKVLYDDDVLEEEFIVQWFNKGLAGNTKGTPIWKNVQPFVEWLQSAESESEEE